MRLLITGTRYGWDETELKDALASAYFKLAPQHGDLVTLVHGDAPGVDTQAANIWTEWNLPVEAHPADWSQGKSAGPKRNQAMVDSGADLCLGFTRFDSRGTWHCLRAAAQAGIPTQIFHQTEESTP